MNNRAEVCRRYYLKNREEILRKAAEDRKTNPQRRLEVERKYRHKNWEVVQKSRREFHKRNPGRVNKYANTRYHKNPLMPRLRARVHDFVNKTRIRKDSTTREMVGCSADELKMWLMSHFLPGMSWENRASWHVDHRIPLSVAQTKEEMELLCHYSNLQPLWAAENIRKHATHGFESREAALDAARKAKQAAIESSPF